MTRTTHEENFIILNHLGFYTVALYGTLEQKLEDTHLPEELQRGSTYNQGSREFLATYHLHPTIDLTLTRTPNGETALVAYTLEKEASKELITEVAKTIQLLQKEAPESFLTTLAVEIPVSARTYKQSKTIARLLNCPLENAFGFVWYAHFLETYRELSSEDSLALAGREYDIRFP